MTSLHPIELNAHNLPVLAPRALNAHKGQFGHLLVVGGDYGTAGAPLLAANMALRAGAGMVSVATRVEHCQGFLAYCPELMCLGVNSANQLINLANKSSVQVVGMGLGQGAWGQSLISLMSNLLTPQVWDADALNLLAKQRVTAPKNVVLTPHLGEAARLLNCDIATIAQNKITAIQNIVRCYQCTVVLKGRGTLIADPQGNLYICNKGHPAMAGAGFGDILAGLIGALIAQHLTPTQAALLAVWLHAKAGEILGQQGRGLLASDLFPIIRQLLEEQCPCLN